MRLRKSFKRPEPRVSKKQSFDQGFEAGYQAAISDFLSKETVELSEMFAERDFNDYYTLGYETGYCRKFAELALY